MSLTGLFRRIYYILNCEFLRSKKKIIRLTKRYDIVEKIDKQLVDFKHKFVY
jgi:hypothetical protein